MIVVNGDSVQSYRQVVQVVSVVRESVLSLGPYFY